MSIIIILILDILFHLYNRLATPHIFWLKIRLGAPILVARRWMLSTYIRALLCAASPRCPITGFWEWCCSYNLIRNRWKVDRLNNIMIEVYLHAERARPCNA